MHSWVSKPLYYGLGNDRAELYELADRLVEYYSETIEHNLAVDTDGHAELVVKNIDLI